MPCCAYLCCAALQGAFYVLPEMKAFYGPGVEAAGYGPIADVDALCMYLIQQAHVSWGCYGTLDLVYSQLSCTLRCRLL
jgi:hypothetical protein